MIPCKRELVETQVNTILDSWMTKEKKYIEIQALNIVITSSYNYVTGNHHICKPSNLQALKRFYSPRRLFFSLQVHYTSVSDINQWYFFFCNFNLFFNSDISVGKKHFHREMNKICEIITKAIVLSSSQ